MIKIRPEMAEKVLEACRAMINRGAPTQYDDLGFNKISYHVATSILAEPADLLTNNKIIVLINQLIRHKGQVSEIGYDIEEFKSYQKELKEAFPFEFTKEQRGTTPTFYIGFAYNDNYMEVMKRILNNYYEYSNKRYEVPLYTLGVLAEEMETVYPGFKDKLTEFLHDNGITGTLVKDMYGDAQIAKAKEYAKGVKERQERAGGQLTVSLIKTDKTKNRFIVDFPFSWDIVEELKRSIPEENRQFKNRFGEHKKIWLVDDKCYLITIEALMRTSAKIDDQIKDLPQIKAIIEATKEVNVEKEKIDITKFIEIAEEYREPRPGKTMFQHQVEGIAFALANKSVILADDMGLGKSLQATMAAYHLSLEEENNDCPILVICPATLRINWMREIFKWLGEDAGPVQVVSANKTRTFFKDETNKKEARNGDKFIELAHPRGGSHKHYPKKGISKHAKWVIINYDILLKMRKEIIKWAKDSGCKIMIADEAHYLKNADSQRSRAVFGFKEVWHEHLETGEKIKTLPKDKELHKQYKKTYVPRPGIYKSIPIIMPLTGTPITSKNADLFPLAKLIRHELADNKKGFLMRYCAQDLGGRYGKNYDGSNNTTELIDRLSDKMLQRMKHDVLDLPEKQRNYRYIDIDLKEYWDRWVEYVNDYEQRTGKPFSVETAHLTELNVLRNVASQLKVDQIIEFTKDLIAKGKKVILFTGYTKTADKFEEAFPKNVKIVGGMTDNGRDKAVQDFQNNPEIEVAICNIKAAGVGLTLTSATEVIMADLQWLPSDHFQAEDRSYRIGQDKNVSVWYFIANETHEEAVKEVLDEKAKLIDAMEKRNYEIASDWKETVAAVSRMMREKASEFGF